MDRAQPYLDNSYTQSGLENTHDKAMWALQERMRERMRILFSTLFDEIDDSLFSSSEQTGCYEKQQEFLSAMREIRVKRKQFLEIYIDRINYLFQYSPPEDSVVAKPVPVSREVLELDNIYEKMELDLALEAMLAKGTRTYTNYISRLSRHRNFADYNLTDKDSPDDLLLARSIEAFGYASLVFELSLEIKLIIFKLFEKFFLMKIDRIYVDILKILDKLADKNFVNRLYKSTTSFSNKRLVRDLADQRMEAAQRGLVTSNQIRVLVDKRMHKLCEGKQLPDFVENMLLQCWRNVLFLIGLNEGSGSEAWNLATETTEKLVETIQSLGTKGGPWIDTSALQDSIRHGFNLVMMKKQDQETFFSQLMVLVKDSSVDTNKKLVFPSDVPTYIGPSKVKGVVGENRENSKSNEGTLFAQWAEEKQSVEKLNAADMAELMSLIHNSDEQDQCFPSPEQNKINDCPETVFQYPDNQ